MGSHGDGEKDSVKPNRRAEPHPSGERAGAGMEALSLDDLVLETDSAEPAQVAEAAQAVSLAKGVVAANDFANQ